MPAHAASAAGVQAAIDPGQAKNGASDYHAPMIFGRHTSRRTRLRLALLASIALLLQQLTFAAYACVAPVAAAPTAMGADCEGMSMPMPAVGNDALCGHYCAQPTTQVPDVRTPTVPPMLLPAMLPDTTLLIALAPVAAPAYCAAPHPSPPPATILYCTLQI